MIPVFLSLALVLLILIISEVLWNAKVLKGEFGRKFVHIIVGSFVAFWPFYMSFRTIQLISIAFLVVVLASRRLKIFKAIRTVDRESWGDILFAVGVGLTATIAPNDWVFMVAILNLSLADGIAAIVGKRLGKNNRYKVFGYEKSIAGTMAFWLVSLAILLVALNFGSNQAVSLAVVMWLPLAAAALENVAILGFDNIFVPLLVVLILNPMTFAV